MSAVKDVVTEARTPHEILRRALEAAAKNVAPLRTKAVADDAR